MAVRSSQLPLEPLVTGTTLRVSQQSVETAVSGGALSVGLYVAAALSTGGAAAAQFLLEVLSTGGIEVSQYAVETLEGQSAIACSQLVIECLTILYEVLMPAVYPTLIGLSYSVIKRPLFFNASASSQSAREVRVSYSSFPLWEWELIYDYLPDETGNGTTASDLKTLLGFFLSTQGTFTGFLFKDPDDNTVVGQSVGTTDGVTTNWTLERTYGLGANSGTEPIGYVDTGSAFNVYLNGTLQSPTTYDILTTTPVNQQIKFHTAPTTGQTITVDMTYYYYVRFKDDTYDFEKFVDKIWQQRKIVLHSLRG